VNRSIKFLVLSVAILLVFSQAIAMEIEGLSISPQGNLVPMDGTATFTVNGTGIEEIRVRIFDMAGSLEHDTDWVAGNQESVDFTGYSFGVHLYRVDAKGGEDEWFDRDFIAVSTYPELQLEVGTVSVGSSWVTVNITKEFQSPIVIIKSVEAKGNPSDAEDIEDYLVPRVRNVTQESFQVALQGIPKGTPINGEKTVPYIIVERGFHSIGDFTLWAGTVDTKRASFFANRPTAEKIFAMGFVEDPVLFTTISSFDGSDPATTRNKKPRDCFIFCINRDDYKKGFRAMIDEPGWTLFSEHANEEISFLAITPGLGELAGYKVYVENNKPVTDQARTVNFTGYFDDVPIFISDMQTNDGEDFSIMRYASLTKDSAKIMVAEKAGGSHNQEMGGFIALEEISGGPTPTPTGLMADFSMTPSSGQAVIDIAFDTSSSTGAITSYEWNFGDSQTGTGQTATHTYDTNGTFIVTLTVSDGTDTAQKQKTLTLGDGGTTGGDGISCEDDSDCYCGDGCFEGLCLHPLLTVSKSENQVIGFKGQSKEISTTWTLTNMGTQKAAITDFWLPGCESYDCEIRLVDNSGTIVQPKTGTVPEQACSGTATTAPQNEIPEKIFFAGEVSLDFDVYAYTDPDGARGCYKFDASNTHNPDHEIGKWEWYFEDPASQVAVSLMTGPVDYHCFSYQCPWEDNLDVKLTVYDWEGNQLDTLSKIYPFEKECSSGGTGGGDDSGDTSGTDPSFSLDSVLVAPNPFKQGSSATFTAQGTGIEKVKLEIRDLSGARVFRSDFVDGTSIQWDGKANDQEAALGVQPGDQMAAGAYIYILTAQNGTEIQSKGDKVFISSGGEDTDGDNGGDDDGGDDSGDNGGDGSEDNGIIQPPLTGVLFTIEPGESVRVEQVMNNVLPPGLKKDLELGIVVQYTDEKKEGNKVAVNRENTKILLANLKSEKFRIKLSSPGTSNCVGWNDVIGSTGEQVVPRVLFDWSFNAADDQAVAINQCDQGNSEFTYCDATQFSIELLKKLNKIDGLGGTGIDSLEEFKAYLIADTFSEDFRKDFDYHYKNSFFGTPTFYTSPSGAWSDYFSDETRFVFEPNQINGSGLYNVKLEFSFESGQYEFFGQGAPIATVTVRITKEHDVGVDVVDSPFYHLPFNGMIGSDRTDEDSKIERKGYGIGFNNAAGELKINLDSPPVTTLIGSGSLVYSTNKFTDFKTLNVYRRGQVLNVNLLDRIIEFMPGYAMPVIMGIESHDGKAQSFYYPMQGGAFTEIDSPSSYWTGIAASPSMDCKDFVNSALPFRAPDIRADSVGSCIMQQPDEKAFGLFWENSLANNDQLFLKSIFYTSYGEEMSISSACDSVSGIRSIFASPLGVTSNANQILVLQSGHGIQSFDGLKDRIRNGEICMASDNGDYSYFWNPSFVEEQLNDAGIRIGSQWSFNWNTFKCS